MTSLAFKAGDNGFHFGDHFIRLVQDFTTEAGTVEEVGFVATDLARALERGDGGQVTRALDPDQKGLHLVQTPGGPQTLTCITESGFYDVVVRSDKPQGKELRSVVTREVLPKLRKTGSFSLVQQPDSRQFIVDANSAKTIADLVAHVGGDSKISMAKSLTVLAKKYPDQSKLLYESQRILCPASVEFVNTTGILEELTDKLSEDGVKAITKAAKEVGWIEKADQRHLVNALLVKAGLQQRGGRFRNQASWIPTTEGAKLSREETRPDIQTGEFWVPQLLWLKSETTHRIVNFIKNTFSNYFLTN